MTTLNLCNIPCFHAFVNNSIAELGFSLSVCSYISFYDFTGLSSDFMNYDQEIKTINHSYSTAECSLF